jgi:hypothetical protein
MARADANRVIAGTNRERRYLSMVSIDSTALRELEQALATQTRKMIKKQQPRAVLWGS